jgi:hypothetical protein
MNNRDIQAAWKYHDGTKHSYWSIRNNPHFLDWANRPQPFKIYPKIAPLPLAFMAWKVCGWVPVSVERHLRDIGYGAAT